MSRVRGSVGIRVRFSFSDREGIGPHMDKTSQRGISGGMSGSRRVGTLSRVGLGVNSNNNNTTKVRPISLWVVFFNNLVS